jgi:two-component system sensor histidine kinase TctE
MKAPTAARRPFLYRQLTLRLMAPLMLIVAAVGSMGLYSAETEASSVFDSWLLDAAVSLANQVRPAAEGRLHAVDLPEAARAMLAYDEVDRTWFAVEDHGRLLAGSAGIPSSGRDGSTYPSGWAFDAAYQGRPVRVAAVAAPCAGCEQVVVLVAETLVKRRRASHAIAWLLLPLALMLGVTCWAIFLAIRRTVGPLEAMAAQWQRQSHASLRAIAADDLPHELSPFAVALNDLLARIRDQLARERMFAAAAAHQLRTPLTALRLGLARARSSPDLENARAVLDELARVTETSGRLVQQLMLLGRLDPEGRVDVDRLPTDLRDVARDVCQLFAEPALEQEIDLELRAPDAAVTVNVQPDLLVEALANLIDNATKAAGPRGQVLVTVLDAPPRVRVSDSGPGIRPHERETVFERYMRGTAATWSGTGLGLAIVRDIAQLQHARVAVVDGELRGACFEFSFGAAEEGEGGADAGPAQPRRAWRRMRAGGG